MNTFQHSFLVELEKAASSKSDAERMSRRINANFQLADTGKQFLGDLGRLALPAVLGGAAGHGLDQLVDNPDPNHFFGGGALLGLLGGSAAHMVHKNRRQEKQLAALGLKRRLGRLSAGAVGGGLGGLLGLGLAPFVPGADTMAEKLKPALGLGLLGGMVGLENPVMTGGTTKMTLGEKIKHKLKSLVEKK
jgi:hypothetical protein